jgi:transposase
MFIATIHTKTKSGEISHTAYVLRESYREGKKVKSRTIANLSHCSKEEITAITWALKNKKDINQITPNIQSSIAGKRFGAVYCVHEILKKFGIVKIFGNSLNGKLGLLQIISRVINQGSRLSTIRTAGHQALCEVLQIEDKISEDNLYKNLAWLSDNQKSIEQKIFQELYKSGSPDLYLYDVTSSYFEGQYNELANYGYNRDKKSGKKQVVAGLLCDPEGYPITIEIFEGNTLDFNTLEHQIKRVAKDFNCKMVTFVGDRGMIKSKQIESLTANDFYFITAITKPQIEKLLQSNVLQMSFFDTELKETEYDSVRYILRRNPARAEEISRTRTSKQMKIETSCKTKNEYLKAHPKAQVSTAVRALESKINKLKLGSYVSVVESSENNRELIILINNEELSEISRLDGCYVIKSNLPKDIDKSTIHSRYKDLSQVETAFKHLKTETLELRPWFVLKEESTRGHAFVAMLAYMVVKYLQKAWIDKDITVNEGLTVLDSLIMIEETLMTGESYNKIPEPNIKMKELLDAAKIKIPKIFPKVNVNVGNRKKLTRKG